MPRRSAFGMADASLPPTAAPSKPCASPEFRSAITPALLKFRRIKPFAADGTLGAPERLAQAEPEDAGRILSDNARQAIRISVIEGVLASKDSSLTISRPGNLTSTPSTLYDRRSAQGVPKGIPPQGMKREAGAKPRSIHRGFNAGAAPATVGELPRPHPKSIARCLSSHFASFNVSHRISPMQRGKARILGTDDRYRFARKPGDRPGANIDRHRGGRCGGCALAGFRSIDSATSASFYRHLFRSSSGFADRHPRSRPPLSRGAKSFRGDSCACAL